MKFRSLTHSVIILTVFLLTINLHAQVTIGSHQAPITGAILDLKEESTTTKGLGLPRVKLKSLTITNATTEVASTIDGAPSEKWDKDEHIGLVVYQGEDNITATPSICKGMYVWTGDQWESLTPQQDKPDITMIDTDGNTYHAKWFGDSPCNGAYWTTSNLYTTKDKDGTTFVGGVRLNPAYRSGPSGAVTITSKTDLISGIITANTYGVSSISGTKNNPTQTYLEFVEEYGLLYKWDQASMACPGGWHLATTQEWDNLAAYHGQYATAGPKMRKSSTWGYYYTSQDNYSHQWGENDGLSQPEPSGFNAVPSGRIDVVGPMDFAAVSYWWSATSGTEIFLNYNGAWLYRSLGVNPNLNYSVRCVKD